MRRAPHVRLHVPRAGSGTERRETLLTGRRAIPSFNCGALVQPWRALRIAGTSLAVFRKPKRVRHSGGDVRPRRNPGALGAARICRATRSGSSNRGRAIRRWAGANAHPGSSWPFITTGIHRLGAKAAATPRPPREPPRRLSISIWLTHNARYVKYERTHILVCMAFVSPDAPGST